MAVSFTNIFDFLRNIVNNVILFIMYIITSITEPSLIKPHLLSILTQPTLKRVINSQMAAHPKSKSFLFSESFGINKWWYYFYIDLDRYKNMVKNREVKKKVSSINLWLIGFDKDSKTLFTESNEFRDEWKYKYISGLTRDHMKNHVIKFFNTISSEISTYPSKADKFIKKGMHVSLQYLAVKLAAITHFNSIPPDNIIEAFRMQSSPATFVNDIITLIKLLFISGPNSRKYLREQIAIHKKEKHDDILNSWIESGMDDNILMGELTHNMGLAAAPIPHQFAHILYYLWKRPDIKQKLLEESKRIDISNIDELDQLVELDKFVVEICRTTAIDFGFNVTLKDTPEFPKDTVFDFLSYTAGYKEKYWGKDYGNFNPHRFTNHIKDSQAQRCPFASQIEKTVDGEYVPQGLYIPNYEGYSMFGVGERRCPGEVYIYYIMKVFTLILIRALEWDVLNPDLIENKVFNGLLSPQIGDDVRFIISKRAV
jgi:hypothetical protein